MTGRGPKGWRGPGHPHGRGFGRPGGWQQADLPPADDAAGWFAGRLPDGWFTGSPTPDEHGPAVIAAHVDWNHAPGVFFHLRDLEPGAEVAVDRADGTTARFEVLEVEQYPKDAFPTERVYGDIDHAGLRLITCGGSFDRTARSYRDNVVVYAGLVGRA